MREWLLEQWEKEKKTVLFITHDVEEAVFLSSRILVVEQYADHTSALHRSSGGLSAHPAKSFCRPEIAVLEGRTDRNAQEGEGVMEQRKINKMGSRMNAQSSSLILALLLVTWQAAAMGM